MVVDRMQEQPMRMADGIQEASLAREEESAIRAMREIYKQDGGSNDGMNSVRDINEVGCHDPRQKVKQGETDLAGTSAVGDGEERAGGITRTSTPNEQTVHADSTPHDSIAVMTEVPAQQEQQQQQQEQEQQQEQKSSDERTSEQLEIQEIVEADQEEAPLPKVEMLSVVERARRLGYKDLVATFERKLKYRRLQKMKAKVEEKADEPSSLSATSSRRSETPSSEKDEFSSDDECSYSSVSSHIDSYVDESDSSLSAVGDDFF
jgi:hypothetical protein